MTSTGFAMFSIWYLLLKIVKPISTINELFGLDLFLPAANFYFCPWFVIFSFLYFYTFLILPCRSQSERAGDYLATLPCTVPTRTQLGMIWPVGFTLSVIRQWSLSASEWRCYYSEEPAVFTPVTQGNPIHPAKIYTNLNPLKYSLNFGFVRRHQPLHTPSWNGGFPVTFDKFLEGFTQYFPRLIYSLWHSIYFIRLF